MSRNADYNRLVSCKRWRELALKKKRDASWTCSRCHRHTARLAVHHITPVESAHSFAEMERLCYDEGNLQVLCYECHSDIHKSMRRSDADVHRQRECDRVDRFMEKFVEAGGT